MLGYNRAYKNVAPFDAPDNPSPCVFDQDANKIDIKHVLLGLDAFLHDQTGAPYIHLYIN